MNRATTMSRLERLEFITGRLKSDEPLVVADIAGEAGVSVRTLTRDLQVLRDRGLPIEADRGRGGGVRLHWSWGIGRVNLNYAEAVDLLVSLAVAEQMKSPLLMANLESVRRKLMASFSPAKKIEINKLKLRILIGASASPFVMSSFSTPAPEVAALLHSAFLMMNAMRISYCAQDGARTIRVIEPHYLMLSYPVWYVLAWDHLRGEARNFRCDRIKHVQVLDGRFHLQPLTLFNKVMEGIEAI